MANTIKHKRGSGSNPSASDLVAGEIAIRTDTGVLFIKKDDNSIASISNVTNNNQLTNGAGYITSADGGELQCDSLDVDGAGDISGDLTLSGTGTIKVPVGTTAQRPTAVQGMIRFNTTRGCFEGYNGSNWVNMSPLNIDDVGAT